MDINTACDLKGPQLGRQTPKQSQYSVVSMGSTSGQALRGAPNPRVFVFVGGWCGQGGFGADFRNGSSMPEKAAVGEGSVPRKGNSTEQRKGDFSGALCSLAGGAGNREMEARR